MTASVSVDIFARDRGASANLRHVGDAASHSGDRLRKMGAMAKTGGLAVAGLAAVGVAATAAWTAAGATSLARIERIGAQTDAIIKSTGGAANITRKGIDDLAGSLEGLTGTEAESITEGANMLATFTGIRNETGKNNHVFDQAVVAMTDMNRAMDNTGSAVVDTRKQAVMLGKALNDPVKGVTALQKVGVSFTDSQKEQIKTLVESGDTMKAQKVILAELNKEFGGSAEAFGNSTKGKIERFNHAVGTLQETLAATLAPSIERVTTLMVDKGVPALDRWGRQWNQHAVPSIRNGIKATQDLWQVYKQDGISGLAKRVETLTDTQGKLTPIVDEVTEASEALWRIVKDLAPAFADAAGQMPAFLSPLTLAGDVLGVVADVLEAVPDNIKSLGVQAGIAALLLPRLGGAVTAVTTNVGVNIARLKQWRAEMSYTQTSSAATATAVGKIGGAAKAAAGIGGMLLLSQGMQEADKATGTLMTTLGGAATGFAVGGPWGALIGGGAGLAMGLFAKKTSKAGDAMAKAAPPTADYAQSLDDLTGSLTKATRAAVYKQLVDTGTLDDARKLGVSSRDVVNAVLGQEGAIRRVGSALQETRRIQITYGDAQGLTSIAVARTEAESRRLIKAIEAEGGTVADVAKLRTNVLEKSNLRTFISAETDSWRAASKAKRAEIIATQDLSTLRKKIPKNVFTKIEARGITPTLAGIAKVANHYKGLDNKQVKAIIKAVGIDATVKDVRRVGEQLKATAKTKADLSEFRSTFARHIGDFREQASRGGKDIGKKLGDGTKGAKPDIELFMRSLNGGVTQGKNAASAGSRGIGANMKSGFPVGFAGADGLWSGQVRGAVRSAINAGRAEAGVRSPSRKMMYLGEMMGKGAVVGLESMKTHMSNAGENLIVALAHGLKKGRVSAEKVLDAVKAHVQSTIDKVKSLEGLRDSTVADFKGFSTSVFATQAPVDAEGNAAPQTVAGLLAAQAAERVKALKVRAAVSKLLDMGLSKSLVDQMQAQGAAGIDQLLTLSTASRSQIGQLNLANSQTQNAYGAAGLDVFGQFHGDDLAEARRNERQAEALAKAVRRELEGIDLGKAEFVIRGDNLVAVLKRNQRDKGKP